MSTLVLELDDNIVSQLSVAAARHHKALPDWVAAELTRLAEATAPEHPSPRADGSEQARMRAALENLYGLWKDRGTTDELMRLTRSDD